MTTSSCCVLHHSCRFGLPKYRTLPIILLYSKDEVFRIVEYKPLKLFRVPIFSKVLNIGFNYLGAYSDAKTTPLGHTFQPKKHWDIHGYEAFGISERIVRSFHHSDERGLVFFMYLGGSTFYMKDPWYYLWFFFLSSLFSWECFFNIRCFETFFS